MVNEQLPCVVVYRWEVRDPKRRTGWRLLTWRMTEDDAAKWAWTNETEVRRVEGSREERRDVDGRSPGGLGILKWIVLPLVVLFLIVTLWGTTEWLHGLTRCILILLKIAR